MSLAAATATTPTGLTNKHNDSNNNHGGELHVGIPYRNAPTHSSCPLNHQAPPQSLYRHCQTIYNQPLQASWISPDEDDEDDDEDEVDTESSGSETPPIKDNAAAVVGRYEALLDDEAITKSYLDPPCISSPPITTLEKTKTTSKLSQIKSRIQSTPSPVSTTTMRTKDEGLDKGALLTRTVERDAAIARRPSLSPLPTPPPSTTPRSPLPMGGSSSSSLHSRSSLAQRNMIMRSGSLPSLSYHQQQHQPISSMLSSTSTCSSSSASSDPLFSAGTGSSSNSSNGEANDSSFSPVPSSSSSSRLKLAFQKLRGRHSTSAAATKNNEPMGPSLSDKSTSRKSTCSTITTKSSPTGPAPTKSTSLAKRIRSKFNKSKSPKKTTTTTATNRVSRTTSLTSVATWSYPEQQQQQQQHPSNKGDTTKRLVSNQQERSLRHNNKHRTQQHWPHNHPHHPHHYHPHHHHHRHNLQQQQHHTPPPAPPPSHHHHHHHQRMMQPMPSMSSPPPSKGAIPRMTSDMLLSSCPQQQQPSPMPLAASDTSVVRFARVVSVKETFSRYEYDRGSDPDTVCTRLTPAMAQYIKQELNMYKLNEMPVHEQSRVHTHFFL